MRELQFKNVPFKLRSLFHPRAGFRWSGRVAAFKATKVPSAPNVVYPHIVTALNPPSITTSSELAKQFAQHAEVENLEIAGVAVASEQAGLPWCSVLGVSNEVGQLAHEQWKSHHKSASLAAQKSLARSLHLSD